MRGGINPCFSRHLNDLELDNVVFSRLQGRTIKREEKDRVFWIGSKNGVPFNQIFIICLGVRVFNSYPNGYHLEFMDPVK